MLCCSLMCVCVGAHVAHGALLLIVRCCSWCLVAHGASLLMVPRCSWCLVAHGASLLMVRRCSWCVVAHGASLLMERCCSRSVVAHGALLLMVPRCSWCVIARGASLLTCTRSSFLAADILSTTRPLWASQIFYGALSMTLCLVVWDRRIFRARQMLFRWPNLLSRFVFHNLLSFFLPWVCCAG